MFSIYFYILRNDLFLLNRFIQLRLVKIMDEKDKKAFLEDFEKAEINQKMDMWFFALDQQAIWDEIMDNMSKIARINILKQERAAREKKEG